MKKLFVHNFSIESIISLRVMHGRRPRYELEDKCLGFSSSDNTFQDLLILYEDLPFLVRRFINEEVKDEHTKEALLQLLQKYDKI
eukprot:snap_masked-scaffold_39-processed-gene-2.53-mRNA-1 protein AED:1.00 eAED:1.00 QI:0/0/0/0/1/1/2/0/84